METVRAISLVKKELGVATALGLSNVSHGLPQRTWLNSAFLALTLGAGLDAAIANPSDNRIKETINATALLTGRDEGATNYLIKAGKPSLLMPVTSNNTDKGVSLEALESLIFHGQQEPLIPLIQELLSKHDMLTIINKGILPSLEKIGDLFASGEVFLPQLIMSGDSAKLAFAYLKENFPDNSLEEKGTIVIGTVRGDIHDIGKNITAAVLENHGYKVIDLGKNVSGEEFLAAAIRENAHVVGLSALMTTTMVEMGPIVEMIKNQNSYIKVIIGGAVVTADFARQINADGYGKDAVEAVKLVESLLSKP
jgi:5-methyltetrahydrofolate--homocysteine methyltransferase